MTKGNEIPIKAEISNGGENKDVIAVSELDDVLASNAKKIELSNRSSSVVYKGFYPGADLEYIVSSGRIKENIIVYEAQKEYSYDFSISTGDLIPKYKEDGSIELLSKVDDKEPVFVIVRPFMCDAAGNESYDLEMIISPDGILTLTASTAWVNDDARVFPVSIDPTIEFEGRPIKDATVSTQKRNKNYSDLAENIVGSGISYTRRTYIEFDQSLLPPLPKGSVVTNATLRMVQTKTENLLFADEMQMYVFDCSQSGNLLDCETVTWDNQPLSANKNGPHTDGTKKIDFATIVSGKTQYILNITNPIKNWMEGRLNSGLMLATSDENEFGKSFVGSIDNNDDAKKPTVTINYYAPIGLEDYWAYETIDLGRSGSAHINLFNGCLSYVHDDIVMTGNRLPITVRHVYNYNDNGIYAEKYPEMLVGKKFHLNIQEILVPVTGEMYGKGYRYKHYDGDGTEHYYKEVNSEIVHEYDPKLTIVTKAIDKVIVDESGNEKYFNASGQLYKIKDNNDDEQIYNISGGRVISIVDPAERTVYLDYNSLGHLISITDPSLRSTTFDYALDGDGVRLLSIYYPNTTDTDVKKTAFSYLSSDGTINRITNPDNSFTGFLTNSTYDYCGLRINRVRQRNRENNYLAPTYIYYNEYNESGYASGHTIVEKPHNKSERYIFDTLGHATSVTNQDGQTLYNIYENSASSAAFNSKSLRSDLQTISENILRDHGFELSTLNAWRHWRAGSAGSVSFVQLAGNVNGTRIVKVEGDSQCFNAAGQNFVGIPGQTYGISADIYLPQDLQTDYGAYIALSYEVSGGTRVSSNSAYIKTTNAWVSVGDSGDNVSGNATGNGWRRVSHTVTLPENATGDCRVYLAIRYADGNAYFDNVQLEKSGGARLYNYVENSDFSDSADATETTPGLPYAWTMSDAQAADGVYAMNGRNYLLMSGSATNQKKVSQEIRISAHSGETLIIGGKAAAYATVGNPERKFGIVAELYDGATRFDTIGIDFDRRINMEHQVKATSYHLNRSCTKIVYSFVYYNHLDSVSFDNAFIYRGSFGENYNYDDLGRLDVCQNDEGKTLTYNYNANNDLTEIKQTVSGVTRIVSKFEYSGRKLTRLENISGAEITYSYQDGQVISQTFTGEEDETQSNGGTCTVREEMTYIQGGNYIETFTDESGGVTTYHYDDDAQKGLVEKVVDPKGNETTFCYDSYTDELISVSGNAEPSTPSVTSFVSQNYLPKAVIHNNTVYSYDYDANNRPTAAKVGEVPLISTAYDSRERVASQTYANGDVYTPVYDSRDRTSGDKWNNVQTAAYFYNENDRLSKLVDYCGNTPVSYQYDYAFYGLVNSVTGTDGSRTSYDYDRSGQLSRVSFTKDEEAIYQARFYSNEKGQPEEAVLETLDNTLLRYSYDELSRLKEKTDGIINNSYQYEQVDDSSSRRVSCHTQKVKGNGEALVHEYEYDANGNIVSKLNITDNTYTYDGLDRLLTEKIGTVEQAYTYDAYGNILTFTKNGVVRGTYSYENSSWGDQLTHFNGEPITYDANGNMLSFDGVDYIWDRGGKLTGIAVDGVTVLHYTYDSQGRRVNKRLDGEFDINYTYSGDLLVSQDNGADIINFQYDANGEAVGFTHNTTPYYYLRNIQGDVIAVYDSEGMSQAIYIYDAWGNTLFSIGPMAAINPIRYRGYYHDDEMGLYFLNTRYYSAEWHRFISPDSMFIAGDDLVQAGNMYAYCFNNPVMYTDANGTSPIDVFRTILGGMRATANTVADKLSAEYARRADEISQTMSRPFGERFGPWLGPIVDEIEFGVGLAVNAAFNLWKYDWEKKAYPLDGVKIFGIPFQLRPYFQSEFTGIQTAAGALVLDFHKDRDWRSPNYGNYRTLPGSYQWQHHVGYNWWYDFGFSVGGPTDKKRYVFSVDDQSGPFSIDTEYVIWVWKADYWNLGAGAEIGIYYQENWIPQALGYYEIEPDNLQVRVLMNVFYNDEGVMKHITTDFAQTNWWVTSFTPSIQSANVNNLHVNLKVAFAAKENGKNKVLMKYLYEKFEELIRKGEGDGLSWAPTASVNNNQPSCGNHPAVCSCGTSNACKYYSDNGYEFYIEY